jgi:hypothetical protein
MRAVVRSQGITDPSQAEREGKNQSPEQRPGTRRLERLEPRGVLFDL